MQTFACSNTTISDSDAWGEELDVLGEDFNEGQVVHWIQEYTWATRVLVAVIRVKKCHHGKPGHMVGTSNPSCIVVIAFRPQKWNYWIMPPPPSM